MTPSARCPWAWQNCWRCRPTGSTTGRCLPGFVIMLIPTLTVYAIFQSKLTQGITIGALKG